MKSIKGILFILGGIMIFMLVGCSFNNARDWGDDLVYPHNLLLHDGSESEIGGPPFYFKKGTIPINDEKDINLIINSIIDSKKEVITQEEMTERMQNSDDILFEIGAMYQGVEAKLRENHIGLTLIFNDKTFMTSKFGPDPKGEDYVIKGKIDDDMLKHIEKIYKNPSEVAK